MRRACFASSLKNTMLPPKWEIKAARKTGCAAPWKSSRRALSAQSEKFMFGAIVRFGLKEWIGLRARIRFHRVWIGIFGSGPLKSVPSRAHGRKVEKNGGAGAIIIIRSIGVA